VATEKRRYTAMRLARDSIWRLPRSEAGHCTGRMVGHGGPSILRRAITACALSSLTPHEPCAQSASFGESAGAMRVRGATWAAVGTARPHGHLPGGTGRLVGPARIAARGEEKHEDCQVERRRCRHPDRALSGGVRRRTDQAAADLAAARR